MNVDFDTDEMEKSIRECKQLVEELEEKLSNLSVDIDVQVNYGE